MNKHKNKHFRKFGLRELVVSNQNGTPKYTNAYTQDENGVIRRMYEKVTKRWRKEHGIL
jgi:hypothetical protein